LLGFDFRVEFKPGTSNVVVDALSRRDTKVMMEIAALSAPSFHLFDDLHREFDTDPSLQELRVVVLAINHGNKWIVIDGLVLVGGRVYIPSASPCLQAALAGAHDMGDEGTEKTLHRLRMDFFVSDARTEMRDYVHACMMC
jgi:hypothetical protein